MDHHRFKFNFIAIHTFLPLFNRMARVRSPGRTTIVISNSTSRPPSQSSSRIRTQHVAVGALALSLLYGILSFHFLTIHTQPSTSRQGNTGSPTRIRSPLATSSHNHPPRPPSPPITTSPCPFRVYPPHRYYGLHNTDQPNFLTDEAEYIYGQWPRVLGLGNSNTVTATSPVKLCVNQTEWNTSPVLPFADGTNPSLLSMERIRTAVSDASSLQQQSQSSLSQFVQGLPDTIHWMATVCMTNSQCAWKDTDEQRRNYRISTQNKPDTVRTVILLLDRNFGVVQQATVWLHLDHDWGKKVRKPVDPDGKTPTTRLVALDDARLFVHNGQVWVSYREGPDFGYEAQVLNPLHLEWTTTSANNHQHHQLAVHVKASQTTYFCCGRNMALMENRQDAHDLLSLTWVDPVTVIRVNTSAQPVPPQKHRRKPHPQRQLSEMTSMQTTNDADATTMHSNRTTTSTTTKLHRRLAQASHKSHIHGTNAFMLYLPAPVDAFLGVAHFHRPNDRKANPYARLGHHYTHAFYTISPTPPFQLTALSAEFVYPQAATQAATHHPTDAEMIQFSSGLEWDASTNSIVLAYGINDCEAAVLTLPWSTVKEWLQPVPPSKQVVDCMRPLDMTSMSRGR